MDNTKPDKKPKSITIEISTEKIFRLWSNFLAWLKSDGFRRLIRKSLRVVLIFALFGVFLILTISLRALIKENIDKSYLVELAQSQGGDIDLARQMQSVMEILKKDPSVKLPPGEVPIFAVINNSSKLKNYPLFKDTKDGDQLLFYSKSQWVYVYRPEVKRLLIQGPFEMPKPSAPQAPPQ